MLSQVYSLLRYLEYWLHKEDQYSLQSPSLFRIYQELKRFQKEQRSRDLDIEDFRKSLLTSREEVEVEDFGAGSKRVPHKIRKIAKVTRYSASPRKFALLYQFFCSLTPAETVIELGTCVGISTRYLSRVCKGNVFSFEGSHELISVAANNLKNTPIKFIKGEISKTLPAFLTDSAPVDFALIDANHTYKGTTNAFDLLTTKTHKKSIIAIGDIYWSPEMRKAWEEIKKHPKVKLSLDFYECGILFFQHEGEKAHYRLDY